MKRYLLFIFSMLVAVWLNAQTYQQTDMELDLEIPKDQSLVYEASASIKLLSGFHSSPINGHSTKFSIDRFGVYPPEEGLIGGASISNYGGVVGALPGELNISDLGAAVYSIPILMPNGLGAITPNIAVTYNNQVGNGLLGWGWSVSGLSSIIRTGQTQYHDGNQSAVNFINDRFAIDGKRLMLCSGNYGENGSVYKTELDEMSKIVAYTDGYNGPSRFVIYKKDGTIWEYGCTEDSRVEPQTLNNTALMWLVNKISDPDGNYMIFNYLENKETGESYINTIDYTLNDKVGISSMYRVCFSYGNRSDEETGYVYGNVVKSKKLLTNIIIKNMMSGSVLYEYSFAYNEPGNYSNDYKSMYYRLAAIGLTADGMQLNPTIINWNKSSHYPDNFLSYPLSKSIFNKVPFVGDFNGDGFSDVITVPYKVSNTYSNDVSAPMYINKGDGIFEETPFYTFIFDKTLEWVYVVDFDGDGRDDVIPFYANYDANSNWKAKICVYLNRGNTFTYFDEYVSSRFFNVYPGDFLGNRKVELFINHCNDGYPVPYYPVVVYHENNSFMTQSLGATAYSFVPERIIVDDFNADGLSEIMYLMEHSSIVAKIIRNSINALEFFHLSADDNFDSDDFLFPGDFNGDGYTDLLKYDNNNYWGISFSDGRRFTTPISCMNNNLLNNLVLTPIDRYNCSLQDLDMPSVTIRAADFDGDGKTDVGVFKNSGGNYFLAVGLLLCENGNNNYGFSDIRRFYMHINYSHQYVHVGNFLGHENASILGTVRTNPFSNEIPKIVSLNPHTSKYSVERITDGMGNAHGFNYEYLMPKDNGFYNYDYKWINPNLRTVAIPMTALRSDTVFVNDVPVVAKYSYNNAIYHHSGHGLLGFESGECSIFINNALYETVSSNKDTESTSDYCILLPKSCFKSNSNNQIIYNEEYSYDVFSCSQNAKVLMPLSSVKKSITYDSNSPKSVLKSIIQNIEYQTDMSGNAYLDIVNTRSSVDGVDGSYTGDDALSCSYWAETEYTYANILPEWVVSRPLTIKKSEHYENNESVGEYVVLDYSGSNPYQVTRKTSLPNTAMNYADPLKIVTEYAYDDLGHIIMQSSTSPSERNMRVERVSYGEEYGFRFPTTMINENGWEMNYSYDNNYGNLLSSLDYNSFETGSSSDPFEINKEVALPDGTRNIKVKRWAKENKHSPKDAVYYTWEKSSGNAETMSFYTKNGRLVREVTFGLNGEAVYVDTQYDVRGNVTSKSMPYVAGDEVFCFWYVYDNNDRLVEEICPNGMMKTYTYNGLQKTVSTESVDGLSHVVIESYNPNGWRVQTIDIGGNVVDYEYFSDGKLKSTTINGNANTNVEYEYDGRRNLLKMKDPAIGETLYDYNAYGELKMKKTAKNAITTYDYDDMGEMIRRQEFYPGSSQSIVTQWIYDNKKGKIGTLSGVVYGDSHFVSYDYDDLLRVSVVSETISNKEYITTYSYDAANREEFVTYPSGLTIQKNYSNSGYYRMMVNPDENQVLWRSNAANAMGYVTEYQVGNGLTTHRSYDNKTFLLSEIMTNFDDKPYLNLSYGYDGFGNLINRTSHVGSNNSESFEYDDFNRLVGISLNGKKTGEMVYDDLGNILSKTIDDKDVYYDARYDGSCPYAVQKVKTDMDNLNGFEQTVGYTAFDKMSYINSVNNSLSIEYGYDHNRVRSLETIKGKKKEKVFVGNCEYVDNEGDVIIYTYLEGPMGVFAVCCTDAKGNNSMVYVNKDNLESWCLITDENANVLQRTSYDAWGNTRNDKTWSGNYSGELLCDRGFTGHEHLSNFGIINMNGRAYDPMLSMMMSPDSFIQNTDFSQNYNRYSYCYNNPLTYYDPSGEWVEWLMYGMFNGVVNLVCNRDDIDNFAEGLLSFGAGFISGSLSQGLSECSWVLQVVGGVAGSTLKTGLNNLVKQNTGNGIDWSLIKTASFKDDVMYALGSNLASSVLNANLARPTDSEEGKTIASILCKQKVNRKLFETASKKIVGNIFAGRKLLDGFNITKKNWEDALPYLECLAAIVSDNLEFETSSETLANISDKVLKFDFSGVASKFGKDVNYCYSQFRALFVKKGE